MSDTDLAPVTSSTPATVHDAPADRPGGSQTPARGSGLAASTGRALAAAGEMIHDAVQYTVVVGQLAIAAVRLARLSDQVTGTYKYVEGCAKSVQRLADQAAGMDVDRDTIAEHRDAAMVMLSVLAEAEAMAAATADLSTAFQATADAHEADYGPVDEAAANKEGQMAVREFYSNR
ncbi:hypothetical protein P3T27_006614 [Kitasatospora sp. MAA19]|uniref:hypothetical protein n=1 Tax=Kitasatospora sp. MAA19 TaxID=3035090 RepID=UPI002473871E|nr:hypothetical protein [Kitasatospora sp. MAA19]MDH6709865.1 hypothetical protein [Kitasatospora sp. MAA19]